MLLTHVLNMKSCIILRFPKSWASWPVKSCQNQFISPFLCLVSLCFGIWPLDNDQFSDGCLIMLFFLPLSMIMTTAGLHHWTFHSSIEPENIENEVKKWLIAGSRQRHQVLLFESGSIQELLRLRTECLGACFLAFAVGSSYTSCLRPDDHFP